MKSKLLITSVIFSILFAQTVSAGVELPESAYRKYQEVNLPKLNAPTVVEVPFTNLSLERFDFSVFDKTTKTFQPSLFQSEAQVKSTSVSVFDLNTQSAVAADPSIELPVVNDQTGHARITVSGSQITTSSLFLVLDNYVSLPNTINISAETVQGLKTVLATTQVNSQVINFPQTTASKFIINLSYGQPLRINEIRLGDLSLTSKTHKLRFLAQPGHEYSIYLDADRRVSMALGEKGNLSDNSGVVVLAAGKTLDNPSYVIADTDKDNIPDVRDNCVTTANADQLDVNQNGRGDACDDFDKDGVVNSLDNCRDLPNQAQADEDGDKIGNVCDDEESRLTEKYAWLPWVGMVVAALVVIGLFAVTLISMRKKPTEETRGEEIPPQN